MRRIQSGICGIRGAGISALPWQRLLCHPSLAQGGILPLSPREVTGTQLLLTLWLPPELRDLGGKSTPGGKNGNSPATPSFLLLPQAAGASREFGMAEKHRGFCVQPRGKSRNHPGSSSPSSAALPEPSLPASPSSLELRDEFLPSLWEVFVLLRSQLLLVLGCEGEKGPSTRSGCPPLLFQGCIPGWGVSEEVWVV